jgi:hypothetical protein
LLCLSFYILTNFATLPTSHSLLPLSPTPISYLRHSFGTDFVVVEISSLLGLFLIILSCHCAERRMGLCHIDGSIHPRGHQVDSAVSKGTAREIHRSKQHAAYPPTGLPKPRRVEASGVNKPLCAHGSGACILQELISDPHIPPPALRRRWGTSLIDRSVLEGEAIISAVRREQSGQSIRLPLGSDLLAISLDLRRHVHLEEKHIQVLWITPPYVSSKSGV